MSESVINLESLELQNPMNEVQYIYDDSELNLEDIKPKYISEIMLADGSRAVLINDNIISCLDTHSIVLQDGPEMNQYYISDETIDQNEQSTLENTVNASEMVQYIDESSTTSQSKMDHSEPEIVYVNDEIYQLQDGADLSEYQIAEIDEESSFSMKTVQFGDEIIDLEELVGQQVALKTDNLSYQYAILKDGKLHLQNFNPNDVNEQLNTMSPDDTDNSNLVNDTVDVSGITGKDLITGETVTLDSYISKMKKKTQHKSMYKVNRNKMTHSTARKPKKNINNSSSNISKGLNSLLNKKIPLGQTEDGKMLVGKIITIKKKDQSKEIDKDNLIKINLDNDTEEDAQNYNELVFPVVQSTYSTLSSSIEQQETATKFEGAGLSSNNDVTGVVPTSSADVRSGTSNSSVGLLTSDNSDSPRKIVIHEKIVTKDCFQHISRTLTGLMNMESVKKKLLMKNIVVKVVEKTYSDVFKGYTKKVSYSSGYMAEEYVIGEDDQMHEVWKFVPDNNTKEALFGCSSETDTEWSGYTETTNVTVVITLERSGERIIRVVLDPNRNSSFRCHLCPKAFGTKVQLRVHINNAHTDNENPESIQETQTEEVAQFDETIVQPPDGTKYIFECEECSKQFYSISRLLKHKNSHSTTKFECNACSYRCSTELALKNHLRTHNTDADGFPCYICGSTFSNFNELNYHKRTHEPYKYFSCKICGRSFSRQSNLQRHAAIHKGADALYKCVICGCSYHYISSLTRHVVQNHIDVSRKFSYFSHTEMETEDSNTITETVCDIPQQMEEV